MKKNNFLISIISAMIMITSCEKEIAQTANSPSFNNQNTNNSKKGLGVLKDGEPYLHSNEIKQNGSVGWFLDIASLQNNQAPKVSNLGDANLYCGGITSIELLAGQNIQMGTLSYANDATNLYVTYTTNSDWYMSEVHLYVGVLSGVPKSGGGTPSPGRFPMKQTFSSSTLSQEMSWTIPISSIADGSSFVIAAHSSVLRVDVDGDVVAKETAWATGTRFTSNKNWATYITASIKSCDQGPTGDLSKNTTENL